MIRILFWSLEFRSIIHWWWKPYLNSWTWQIIVRDVVFHSSPEKRVFWLSIFLNFDGQSTKRKWGNFSPWRFFKTAFFFACDRKEATTTPTRHRSRLSPPAWPPFGRWLAISNPPLFCPMKKTASPSSSSSAFAAMKLNVVSTQRKEHFTFLKCS